MYHFTDLEKAALHNFRGLKHVAVLVAEVAVKVIYVGRYIIQIGISLRVCKRQVVHCYCILASLDLL